MLYIHTRLADRIRLLGSWFKFVGVEFGFGFGLFGFGFGFESEYLDPGLDPNNFAQEPFCYTYPYLGVKHSLIVLERGVMFVF